MAGEIAWGSASSDADETWIVTGVPELSPSPWGSCGQRFPALSEASDHAALEDRELSPQSPAPITVTSLLYLLQRDTGTRSQASGPVTAPVTGRGRVTMSPRATRRHRAFGSVNASARDADHESSISSWRMTQNPEVIVGCIQSNRHEYVRERQPR